MLTPALCRKPANTKSIEPVIPAQLSFPGSARAIATSSGSVLTFSDDVTLMPTSVLVTRAIGTKSLGS